MSTSMSIEVQEASLLPFYLVFDVSYSMEPVIGEVNNAMRALKNEILKDPILGDIARVCVLSFSDEARIDVPMCDLADDTRITREDFLQVRGGTSFAPIFDLIGERIAADIADLKGHGEGKVFRPTVFFVTDGVPTDAVHEWNSAFTRLTSVKAYPNLVPFGLGDADEEVLRAITFPPYRQDGYFFMANAGTSAEQAMQAITRIVTQSVVSCTQSAVAGTPGVVMDTRGTEGLVNMRKMDLM